MNGNQHWWSVKTSGGVKPLTLGRAYAVDNAVLLLLSDQRVNPRLQFNETRRYIVSKTMIRFYDWPPPRCTFRSLHTETNASTTFAHSRGRAQGRAVRSNKCAA